MGITLLTKEIKPKIFFYRNEVVSRSRPFPFYDVEEGKGLVHCHRASRSAFSQGRVSVNWFEVGGQPRSKRPGCRADNESHYKQLVKETLAARLPQTN